MKSIIEEIYFGDRVTFEKIDFGEAYWKAHSKCDEIFDKLIKTLNKQQKEQLNSFYWAQAEQESEAILSHYKEGFKIGFLVAVECLTK